MLEQIAFESCILSAFSFPQMSRPIRFPLRRLSLEKFKIHPDENNPGPSHLKNGWILALYLNLLLHIDLFELIGVVCHHGTLHQV